MYFCAFAFVFLIPVAYLACQVLTWVVYEGRWRWWSLVPIPVVLLSFVPLLFVQTPVAVYTVCLGAPGAGLIALGCVWAAYTKAQEQLDESRDDDA